MTDAAREQPALTASMAVNNSTKHLLPTEHMLANQQQCCIAKYLPVQTFKNAATLSQALDTILNEIRTKKPTALNSIISSVAKNIAITTFELSTDYHTKIALIETAYHHRLFRSRNIIKRSFALILASMRRITGTLIQQSKYRGHRSEAQIILDDARSAIQNSRDHIMLC
ncbi:MAG TPA: hypothetical protein VL360_00705 [Gammaproteobacteria bacterium]|jgi:hypothetical protein|nr:hypothetical protein [Gammaproteobacteria bacterium]